MIIRNRPKRPLNLRKKQNGFLMWPERFRQPSSGVAYKDPYWDKTVLNLKMDGANGSTVFTDSSLYGQTVTANGNVQISTAQSKFGGASAYFDGSGDSLSIATTTGVAFGTEDYSLECFLYATASDWTTGNFYLFSNYSGGIYTCGFQYYQNKLRFYGTTSNTGSTLYTAGPAIPVNTWTHVAVCRLSGTTRLFVNGIVVASDTYSTNFTGQNASIGAADTGGGGSFKGYIDAFRITKGAARYVADFIPPIREHPTEWGDQYWNETVLNCNFNTAFTDSSISANVITAYGGAAISTTEKKYGAGSLFLDGSGDYLSSPITTDLQFGTGDYTVEAWVRLASTAGVQVVAMLGRYNTTTSGAAFYINGGKVSQIQGNTSGVSAEPSASITANTWHHVVWCKSGPTVRFFVDGVQKHSFTTSINMLPTEPLIIGGDINGTGGGIENGYLNGYIDSLRITKGIARYTTDFTPPPQAFPEAIADPYAPYTVLHLPFDGANNATSVVDQSWSPKTLTANGNAKLSTAQKKYGTAAAVFDGSGDYFSIPYNAAFDFGTGDFTIEGFLRLANNSSDMSVASGCAPANGSWMFASLNGDIRFGRNNLAWDAVSSGITLTAGIFYHVLIGRASGTLKIFVDGVQYYSGANSQSYSLLANALYIGARQENSGSAAPGRYLNGYLDDLRITKGIARYVANFTPPRIAHPIS